MKRFLLIGSALACPVLLWLASVPVLFALYGPKMDSWGLGNALIVMQLGIPLMYAAIPLGLAGSVCAMEAMRRYRKAWVATLMIVALLGNLSAVLVASVYEQRFSSHKQRQQLRRDLGRSLASLHGDLLDYAGRNNKRLPEHLLHVSSVIGLQDEFEEIDVPGWSPVSDASSLDHPQMTAAQRQYIADWIRKHSRYIYLGKGLMQDAIPEPLRKDVLLVVRRQPLPGRGYPVVTLYGGIWFMDRVELEAALLRSNTIRSDHGLPTFDMASVRARLR